MSLFLPNNTFEGIFNQAARCRPLCWRNLGLIPGLLGSLTPMLENSSDKLGYIHLQDWHYVSKFLLSDVIKLQGKEYLDWHYNGKAVRLHIPVMFIIGDIEGHDKLCSRKHGHTNRIKHVTHSCDIKRDMCSSAEATCRMFDAHEIYNLQKAVNNMNLSLDERIASEVLLDEHGFHPIFVNSYFLLDFGVNRHGLHGACAICLLHTFKQKYPDLVLREYMSLFGTTEDTIGRMQVNLSIAAFLRRCKRKSDRDFPSINTFTFALTKGKITYNANEKYARIFALYLFTLSTFGWNFTVKKSRKTLPHVLLIVKAIEQTLTIYQFLYLDKMPVSPGREDRRACTEVVKYMEIIKEVLLLGPNVKEGVDPCSFPKYHYLKHIFPMILQYGSSRNFDGGPCESNHKYLSKQPGSRTQKRRDVFDEQTSYNLAAKLVLERGCRDANILIGNACGNFDGNQQNQQFQNACRNENDKRATSFINKNSARFQLVQSQVNGALPILKWNKSHVSPTGIFRRDILKFVSDQIFKNTNFCESTIDGFTCLDWGGNIIRAHPSYKSGSPWFDHVSIKWQSGINSHYQCPAKVYMFIDLTDSKIIRNEELKNQMYAVVHSTLTCGRNNKPHSTAINTWKSRGKSSLVTFWTMETQFRLVPVSSFNAVSFVVQDYKDKEMTEESSFVYEILPRGDWANCHL